MAAFEPRLDGVPDAGLEADVVEAVNLLQPRRRGDVNFRQVAADHVDADEDQAPLLQGRADGLADLAVARA